MAKTSLTLFEKIITPSLKTVCDFASQFNYLIAPARRKTNPAFNFLFDFDPISKKESLLNDKTQNSAEGMPTETIELNIESAKRMPEEHVLYRDDDRLSLMKTILPNKRTGC